MSVWRYMDFTKFVSLLDRRALFFPRAIHLRQADSFEGQYSKVTLDHGFAPALNHLLADFDRFVVVNSWHMNDGESAAMWDLYLREGPGVAIRTTYKSLEASFPEDGPSVFIGRVRYIDYLSEVMPAEQREKGFNGLAAFLCKRACFAHEAELRCLAIVQEQAGGAERFRRDGGVYVPLRLNDIIHEIVVSPRAPGWFAALVRSVALKYDIAAPVRTSQMDELPIDLRATDKSPIQFKCPQCFHDHEVYVDASRIEDNTDGTTVVFYARSLSFNCDGCNASYIMELNTTNSAPIAPQLLPPERDPDLK